MEPWCSCVLREGVLQQVPVVVTVTKVHGGVTVTLVRAGWLPVVLVCTEGVCAPTGSSQVSVWSDVYRADLYSECVSRGV